MKRPSGRSGHGNGLQRDFGDWFTWFRSDDFLVSFPLIRRQGHKDGFEYGREQCRRETNDVGMETVEVKYVQGVLDQFSSDEEEGLVGFGRR